MKSTILLENETRDRLKNAGKKGQTYDELINSMLDGCGAKQEESE